MQSKFNLLPAAGFSGTKLTYRRRWKLLSSPFIVCNALIYHGMELRFRAADLPCTASALMWFSARKNTSIMWSVIALPGALVVFGSPCFAHCSWTITRKHSTLYDVINSGSAKCQIQFHRFSSVFSIIFSAYLFVLSLLHSIVFSLLVVHPISRIGLHPTLSVSSVQLSILPHPSIHDN